MIIVQPHWRREVEIALHDQPSIVLNSNEAMSRFEAIVVTELEVRSRLERQRVRASDRLLKPSWLRETGYRVILAWLATGRHAEMVERLETHGRFERGTPREDRDVFQEGIVALFAGRPAFLTGDRKRLTDPMWRGFRHYIPPSLLLAFNHQFPGHTPSDDSSRWEVEPTLRDWIVEQRVLSARADDALEEFRGAYPAIDQRVEETCRAIDRAQVKKVKRKAVLPNRFN